MKTFFVNSLLLLMGVSAAAQTKSAPAPVVSVIEGLTGKRFVTDTIYAALSDEDKDLLAKEPRANWGLLQEAGENMSYSNLVVGSRSYQLVVKAPKVGFPTATLLRYTTPQSKPEPIARGTLQPKEGDKPEKN